MGKNVFCTEAFIETTNPEVVIETRNPRMVVEGCWENGEESSYVTFRKIPYAQPPIGKRRFQPPHKFVPPNDEDQAEEDVRIEDYKAEQMIKEGEEPGIKMGETELDVGDEKTESSQETEGAQVEDCLYLTVYLPRAPKMDRKRRLSPLPVLVYFHGKTFREGRGKYGDIIPEFFMMQDIILVLVNYRTGPFGFLNMHHPKCRGNAGLKDQVMALKWVRDNIAVFGGDAENVTISGHGFGGSCVNLHLISPLSKDLFHKAIIQSGGIFCPWGYRGLLYESFSKYAKYWSMEELMKADAADIIEFDEDFVQYHSSGDLVMAPDLGPSVEFFKKGAFLPPDTSMSDLMKKAKPVPILAGIALEEGYEGIIDGRFDVDAHKKMIKDDTRFCSLLSLNLLTSEEVTRRHLESLRERYYPDIDSLGKMLIKYYYSKLRTDLAFYKFYDNFKLGEHESAPIYIYEYNYSIEIDPSPEHQRLIDIIFSYGNDTPHLDSPHKMEQNIKTVYSFWANFCKTGAPSGTFNEDLQWSPHTDKKPCYLHIDDDNLKVVNGFLHGRRWNYLNEMAQEDYITYVSLVEQESRDLQTTDNLRSHGSQPSSSRPATSIPLEPPRSTERSNFSISNYSKIDMDVLEIPCTPQRVEGLCDLQNMTNNSVPVSRGSPILSSRPATPILLDPMRGAARSNLWTSNHSNTDLDILETQMAERVKELLALMITDNSESYAPQSLCNFQTNENSRTAQSQFQKDIFYQKISPALSSQ